MWIEDETKGLAAASGARPGPRRALAAFLLALLAAPLAAVAAPEAPAAQAGSGSTAVENAVVKIFATARYPDPFRPWTKPAPTEATGSGVVIDGSHILTNAHVVLYASEIQVQANQDGDKLSARVAFVAPGIDLALLTLEDGGFFARHAPIARSNSLPSTKDAVLAYGFPTGGQSLSITKGIVSRTEFVNYNFPVSGLRIQIDAAINPGNSGGPAVVGDRMIGIAFSHLGNAENIGYIIPNEEIDLFLKDVADGRYDGKPALFDEFQTLENPALRRFLKLGDGIRGIVVHEPFHADAGYPLKKWDVITRIGDTPIDDQGEVTVAAGLRVAFPYLVQKLTVNGKVPLTVFRGGETLAIQLPVQPERPLLIPELQGEYPPYFIYGPLVFSKATQLLVQALGKHTDVFNLLSLIGSPLVTQRAEPPAPEREELVLISSPFFPHKVAKGYSNHAGAVVRAVNGTRIRSLRHLVEILRDLRDDSVVIEFDSRGGETLVFSRPEIVAATEDILTDNGVRAQGSPDLLAVWQASK